MSQISLEDIGFDKNLTGSEVRQLLDDLLLSEVRDVFNTEIDKCLTKYRHVRSSNGEDKRFECLENIMDIFSAKNEFLGDESIKSQYEDCSLDYDNRFGVSDKSPEIEERIFKQLKRCITSTNRRASRKFYYEHKEPSERSQDELEQAHHFINVFFDTEDIDIFDIRGIDDKLPPEFRLETHVEELDPESERRPMDEIIDDVVEDIEDEFTLEKAENLAEERIDEGKINVREVLGLVPITLREILQPGFNVQQAKFPQARKRAIKQLAKTIKKEEFTEEGIREIAKTRFENNPDRYEEYYDENAFGEKEEGYVKIFHRPSGRLAGETTFTIDENEGRLNIGTSVIEERFQGKGLFNFIRREVKNIADQNELDLWTTASAFRNQPIPSHKLAQIYTSYGGSDVEQHGSTIISKKKF